MRENGYYWAYALKSDNLPEGWIIIYWHNGSCRFIDNWYDESCFREIKTEMIVHEPNKHIKQLEFIEIADELNQEMYEKHGEINDQFYYNTNGNIDMFGFGDTMLWCSEDDDRVFIEDDNDYEDFKHFITKKFNKWIKSMNNLKL